ncbi:MAG TPA: hypothetical protein PLN21_02720 [Gemmatales bacterium]|nr:hypothetical protein [Gemmatales bacterium]
MQSVYSFILWIMDLVRTWLSLLVPIFSRAADFRKWPRWVRILVRIGVVGFVCWGLWWLGSWDKVNISQYLPTFAQRNAPFYLPIFFLVFYAFCWLLYWLILTFSEDDTVIEFPDIEEAWIKGLEQLKDEGISLGDFPLFLIVGRNAAGEEALFQASGLKDIIAAPGRERSPIRFYAHRDAIYIVCAGATAWGRFCSILAGEEAAFNVAETVAKADMGKTLNPETAAAHMGMDKDLFDELNQLVSLRTERALTPEEQERLQELSDLSKAPQKAAIRREPIPKAVLLNDQARLMYLCRLIKKERRPWCSLNGIFALIPWQSLENDASVKEGYPILQSELGLIRETLSLRSPMIAMICDLETAVGFREFRNNFIKPEMLLQRVGQRLPLVPELPATEIPKLYDQAAHWIGQTVLPKWVLQFLKVDATADIRKTPGVSAPHNANLYFLLREMYLRSPRLGKLLARSVTVADPGDTETLPLFGGCYLAATGKTERETAFVSGVFSRLTESQNYVSWLPKAFQDERNYGWYTVVGYIASIIMLLSTIGLIYWMITHPNSG